MAYAEKFYVATDFARKEDARAIADTLESFGFELNARWITNQPLFLDGGLGGELTGADADAALQVAEEDLEDIRRSKVFIQLTSGEKARGGRHVELGYALAQQASFPGRTVLVVGPREHAFHYHSSIQHLPGTDQLETWAAGYMAGARL